MFRGRECWASLRILWPWCNRLLFSLSEGKNCKNLKFWRKSVKRPLPCHICFRLEACLLIQRHIYRFLGAIVWRCWKSPDLEKRGLEPARSERWLGKSESALTSDIVNDDNAMCTAVVWWSDCSKKWIKSGSLQNNSRINYSFTIIASKATRNHRRKNSFITVWAEISSNAIITKFEKNDFGDLFREYGLTKF